MRIVTRPDFDGIVCAVLLLETFEITHPILWAEPNDMQHNKVPVRDGDIIANMPYHDKCSFWFDHHVSNKLTVNFVGKFDISPSAARVVFDYVNGTPDTSFVKKLNKDYTTLIEATDKIDSADLTLDEVLHPENYPYIVLSMTIANNSSEDESYWNRLVELLRTNTIDQILADAEVKKRCDLVIEENRIYKTYLKDNTILKNGVCVTDFRKFDIPPNGNRFLVYSLFPDARVSIKIRNYQEDRLIANIGHSIFNKTCLVNSGILCAKYGGGGHFGAGSCNFPKAEAKDALDFIIKTLDANEKL